VALTVDLLPHKVDRSCPCSVHHLHFIRIQNIRFTSLVTDERMDGQSQNVKLPPANLAWWKYTKVTLI